MEGNVGKQCSSIYLLPIKSDLWGHHSLGHSTQEDENTGKCSAFSLPCSTGLSKDLDL